jgi:hypothetical protein
MDHTILYRSLATVDHQTRGDIEAAAREYGAVEFAPGSGVGYLEGGGKPNIGTDPDLATAAAKAKCPDGNVAYLLEILCRLSAEFTVDWELTGDDEQGSLGFIRNGNADEELTQAIRSLLGRSENIGPLPSAAVQAMLGEPHDMEEWGEAADERDLEDRADDESIPFTARGLIRKKNRKDEGNDRNNDVRPERGEDEDCEDEDDDVGPNILPFPGVSRS